MAPEQRKPQPAGYSGTPLANKLGIRADETWSGLKLMLRRSERVAAAAGPGRRGAAGRRARP